MPPFNLHSLNCELAFILSMYNQLYADKLQQMYETFGDEFHTPMTFQIFIKKDMPENESKRMFCL